MIDLEGEPDPTHIGAMTTRAGSTTTKPPKAVNAVLGRSAATGRFVLKPASKPGAVSLKAARTAVATVLSNKKR